jgi:hypothetical protein
VKLATIINHVTFVSLVLLPVSARAQTPPCHHGVVCVKEPGPDVLLEARAGGAVYGVLSPLKVTATLGFGNLGLGLPRNIFFIAEVGFNGGTQTHDETGMTANTFDVGGGVRAFWPTRSRVSVFGDVLFGAASHWLGQGPTSGSNDQLWTIMGQLALGFELHLYGRLFLVGHMAATFFGVKGAVLVAIAANGKPETLAYAAPGQGHEVGALRLAVTAGPSFSF